MVVSPSAALAGPQLHQLVAEGTPDLLTVVSDEGVYRFVSAAGAATFGWAPDDLVGQAQEWFAHPDDVPLLAEDQRALLAGEEPAVTTVRRLRCRNGTYRWVESRSRVEETCDGRVVVSAVRDIAERRRSELELLRQAATDPLTGVANRTVFMDRLQHALHRLARQDSVVAVLFLDLDRFKVINDSLGHHVGDAVLLQVAERLLQVLRPQDTLARLGGDEFAIVAEDLASATEAVALGARVIDAGRRPFVVGDEQFVCTTSAGIAVTTDAGHSAEGLLQEADLALYRAKDRGRDRADVFDEDLRSRAVGRLGTERMLRRAIDEDRLRISYQPIVELHTGRIVAAEALVRVWDPDQPELIVAQSFIDVAEESGMLATIDDWMLHQVVVQAAAWRDRFQPGGLGAIAINLTARHLADAEFAPSVVHDLAARDLEPSVLQIEVTERVLMEASNSAINGLKTLRAAGVQIGLDDFGTGYSSLSYLRSLPVDFVKIDRSFVHGLQIGEPERAIVACIIDLSHALGMTVVAEGVETQDQHDQLVAIGCDRAQGFYFAPASPSHVIEAALMNEPASGSHLERAQT